MNAPAPAIDTQRQHAVAKALREFLPPASVLIETEDVRPYECDGLSAFRQLPMVVALPEELVKGYLEAGQLTVLGIDLGLRMDAYGIVTRRGHQLSPGAELYNYFGSAAANDPG